MPVLRQQQRKRANNAILRDFGSGLNTFYDPIDIKPSELVVAENVVMDGAASISKRNGFANRGFKPITSPTGEAQGFGSYTLPNGRLVEWVVIDGTFKVRDETYSGPGYFDPTGTFGNGAFSTTAKFSAVPAMSAGAVQSGATPISVSSSTNNSVTFGGQTFATDIFKDKFIVIESGHGAGQIKKIAGNTATQITLYESWEINPSAAVTNTPPVENIIVSKFSVYNSEISLYVVNDSDNDSMFKYTHDSTSPQNSKAELVTNAPKGGIIAMWNGRMCVSGTSTDGTANNIYLSQINNPSHWEVDKTNDDISTPQVIYSADGRITAMETYTTGTTERLLWSTPTKVNESMQQTAQGAFEVMFQITTIGKDFSHGVVSDRTMIKAENAIMVLAGDGSVRRVGEMSQFNNGIRTQGVSRAIRPDIRTISNTENAVAVWHLNKYYLATRTADAPTSTTQNNIVYVYDAEHRGWTTWTMSFADMKVINGEVCGLQYDGQVVQYKNNNDTERFVDGTSTPIKATIETKDYTFSNSDEKTFSSIRFWLLNRSSKSSNSTIEILSEGYSARSKLGLSAVALPSGTTSSTNIADSLGTLGTGIATTGGQVADIVLSKRIKWEQIPLVLRAVSIRLVISNEGLNEDLKLSAIEMGIVKQASMPASLVG